MSDGFPKDKAGYFIFSIMGISNYNDLLSQKCNDMGLQLGGIFR